MLNKILTFNFRIIPLIIFLICLWANGDSVLAARTEPLKASITQNEVTDRLETLGIKSIIHVGAKETIYVDSVRMGSKAFYKGVEAGDLIRGLVQKDENTFCLNIERQGKPYQIIFTGVAEKPLLDPAKPAPVLVGTAGKRDIPQLPVTEQTRSEVVAPPKEKALIKYDIELVIDISGSMNEVDGTDGLSKFEWCHDQVRDLARRLAPYQRTLTITTFNNQFETEENCSVDRVEEIYANTRPHGGTDLVDPLNASLNRASGVIGGPRRALIAVITDGLPNVPRDPTEVNRAIIRFTQRLANADQVIVTVLQVGDTFNGQSFCKSLDDDLVAEGAKFDIVDTQTFAQLKRRGLTNALVDSIIDEKLARVHAAHGGQTATGFSADADVQKLKEERAQIEKQLLDN
jgi:hypothetical protein